MRAFFVLALSLFTFSLFGGPLIHEAFVTVESDAIVIQGVAKVPPPRMHEEIPPQPHIEMVWIPGYWKFVEERNEYVWICGIWRRPVPHCHFIPGEWKFKEGLWVWCRGFWSRLNYEEIEFIQEVPPEPLEEDGVSEIGHFWVPGHYQWAHGRYIWINGGVERFDPNWVYVPPCYLWREAGYIFVPGYWDFRLERRGYIYSCETRVLLEPTEIIQACFPYYPDFICFYHYVYFFHREFWRGWGVLPPWFAWGRWWFLTRHRCWALWWWWTHPGYVPPLWMDREMARRIAPPPHLFVEKMHKVMAPPIVTPHGVVSQQKLLAEKEKVLGNKLPILPRNRESLHAIEEAAQPAKNPLGPSLRPHGTGKEVAELPPLGKKVSPRNRPEVPPKPNYRHVDETLPKKSNPADASKFPPRSIDTRKPQHNNNNPHERPQHEPNHKNGRRLGQAPNVEEPTAGSSASTIPAPPLEEGSGQVVAPQAAPSQAPSGALATPVPTQPKRPPKAGEPVEQPVGPPEVIGKPVTKPRYHTGSKYTPTQGPTTPALTYPGTRPHDQPQETFGRTYNPQGIPTSPPHQVPSDVEHPESSSQKYLVPHSSQVPVRPLDPTLQYPENREHPESSLPHLKPKYSPHLNPSIPYDPAHPYDTNPGLVFPETPPKKPRASTYSEPNHPIPPNKQEPHWSPRLTDPNQVHPYY